MSETLQDQFLYWNNHLTKNTGRKYTRHLRDFSWAVFNCEPTKTTLDHWKELDFGTVEKRYIKPNKANGKTAKQIRESFNGVRSFITTIELEKREILRLKESVLIDRKKKPVKHNDGELSPTDVAKALLLFQAKRNEPVRVNGKLTTIDEMNYAELKKYLNV